MYEVHASTYASLQSLKDRSEQLIRYFFHSITEPSSCIHHTLPPT